MGSTDSTVTPSSTNGGALRHASGVVGWKLAGVAIGLQVVLLWDLGALFLTDTLIPGNFDMSEYPTDATVMAGNRVLVAGVWALAVGVVYYWSRRRGIFERMFTWRDEGRLFVASLAAVALHVLDTAVMAAVAGESLGPQALGEHAFFVGLYGSAEGSVVFLLQCLYYLFEALIVVFMIALFQRASGGSTARPCRGAESGSRSPGARFTF